MVDNGTGYTGLHTHAHVDARHPSGTDWDMMGHVGARTSTNACASWGSVMGCRPYWRRPARSLRSLENRITRLMRPPEKTLPEKVRSLGNPAASEPPYDPSDLVLDELRRFARSRCGAKTRRGTPCKRKALRNGRCPNHGGLSTGPRTLEGRRRALANLKQFQSL